MTTPNQIISKKMVHQALRHWKSLDINSQNNLEPLLLVRQQREKQIFDEATYYRHAINNVLDDGLQMYRRLNPEYENLIRAHFVDGKMHEEIAQELGVTKNVIKAKQKKALDDLTAILNDMEQTCREQEKERLFQTLSQLRRSRLVGVDHLVKQMITWLTAPDRSELVIVSGLGGIGKTSLVETAVFKLVEQFFFHNVVWVRVNNDRLAGDALTFGDIQDDLVSAMGHFNWATFSDTDQITHLKYTFQTVPHLVIIDNIEKPVDDELLHMLKTWSLPSRFIITSRRAIQTDVPSQPLNLQELSMEDAAVLIRQQAQREKAIPLTNFTAEQIKPIYEIIGGNPLAIKLVVGLTHTRPLQSILVDLQEAQTQKTQKMYTFIYLKLWNELSDNARAVLEKMYGAAETGFRANTLSHIAKMPAGALWDAVDELIDRSLMEKSLDVNNPLYSIHRLTASFLKTEIINWPHDADSGYDEPDG